MTSLIHRILIAAAILIPLALFSGAAWLNYRDVQRDGQEAVVRTAAVMHEHARKVFDTVELVLDLVDSRLAGQTWEEIASPETSAFLQALNARYEQTVSIWVTNIHGKVQAGSQPWDRSIALVDRDFFEAHREADVGIFISRQFVGKATNIASFAVSRRRSSTGDFDGTIHVSLSPAYFEHFYTEAAPRPEHAAVLIRADGEVLSRSPATKPGLRLQSETSSLMRAITTGAVSGEFYARSSLDGVDRFSAFRNVAPYPLYVNFALDTSAMLSRWYGNLAIYGVITAVASLILLLFSWLSISRAQAERVALEQLKQEVAQRNAVEERLRVGQRLEAIGQITGGVAHDFNNLLMIIAGGIDRLSRLKLEPKYQRYIDAIGTAAQRGEKLTRQLLTFSRQQPVVPVVVDTGSLIAGVHDALQSSLRGDINLVLDLPPGLWPVKIDEAEFELALINIAVNARDAMPNGGTFTISARNQIYETGPNGISGDFVVIGARDTGTGIPPGLREKVFEPFFTTKAVGKGTGLGLSQVYGFVYQANGTVTVESEMGGGTEIAIHLPRSHESVSPNVETEAPPSKAVLAPAGHRRILMVEDNLDIADVTRANLETLGYRVIHVPTGTAALDLLGADNGFDLVFSDIVMPGEISGIELARRIRKAAPSLPVLLTTGYSVASESALLEGFPLLQKPYRLELLHEKLEDMIVAARPDRSRTAGPGRTAAD